MDLKNFLKKKIISILTSIINEIWTEISALTSQGFNMSDVKFVIVIDQIHDSSHFTINLLGTLKIISI